MLQSLDGVEGDRFPKVGIRPFCVEALRSENGHRLESSRAQFGRFGRKAMAAVESLGQEGLCVRDSSRRRDGEPPRAH